MEWTEYLRKEQCILDIQGKNNIQVIKKELNSHIGDIVRLNYNLGRNKYETYEVQITQLYNNIFLVKQIHPQEIVKSFSYTDIITETIKIEYN